MPEFIEGLYGFFFPAFEVQVGAANPTFDIDLGPPFPGLCAAAGLTYADSGD